MRIAMVGSRGLGTNYGGIERSLDDLCPNLAALGHHVDVFARFDAPGFDHPHVRSIKTWSAGGKYLETISRSTVALWQAMGRYDVVHFHALGPGVLTLATGLLGQKSVVTIHGLDHERAKWGAVARSCLKFAEKAIVRNADRVTVVAENLQDYFALRYGAQTAFIPNGVTAPTLVPPGPALAEFGLAPKRYVLFASRLTPEKGCHDLIDAFNDTETDMKLVIAGAAASTQYLDDLKSRANPEKVCFVGHRSGAELAEIFSNAYLFVLPSYIEGMSMALLEAISFGLPIIASDITENRAVLGDWGLYFKKQDVAGLRHILRQMIADPERAIGVKEALAELRHPDWCAVARMYDALYHSVCASRVRAMDVTTSWLE